MIATADTGIFIYGYLYSNPLSHEFHGYVRASILEEEEEEEEPTPVRHLLKADWSLHLMLFQLCVTVIGSLFIKY